MEIFSGHLVVFGCKWRVIKTHPPLFFAAAAAALLPISSLHAAALATDTAGNYNGTYAGLNSGTGFGAYTVTSNNTGNTGAFLGDSTKNGSGTSGGINDASGTSFALYANSGGQELVNRSFTADASGSSLLAAGQTFSLGFDNGLVNTGSTVGINLFNANNVALFTFEFVGGGNFYSYDTGTGTQTNTTVGFTDGGLNLSFAQGAGNAFTFTVTPVGGTATTINGTLASSAISQFQVFDNNAGSGPQFDTFFNAPTVVPEPSTWFISLAGLGLLGAVRRFRRVSRV